MRQAKFLVLLVAVGAALGACRQEERTRPLTYEKGVYAGEQSGSKLSPQQQQELRRRTRQQATGGI